MKNSILLLCLLFSISAQATGSKREPPQKKTIVDVVVEAIVGTKSSESNK